MAQQPSGDFNIDPATTSGSELATILNNLHAALATMRSGTSRPYHAAQGTLWLDTTTAATHLIKYYTGSADITIASIDTATSTIQLSSNIATGTPPLTVSSTTLVNNLNADMVDGVESTQIVHGVDSTACTWTTTIDGISKSGFYDSSNPTNAAFTGINNIVHLENSNTSGVAWQIAIEDNYIPDMKVRVKTASTWHSWRQLAFLDEVALEAQESWNSPTLSGSWANYGSGYETAQYYKDTIGIVHVKGMVTGETTPTTIFTLPSGYRPLENMIFSTTDSTNSPVRCQVASGTGVLSLLDNCTGYVVVDCHFRAA